MHNIFGAISAGVLGSKFPKRYLLSIIYFLRAIAITAFIRERTTSGMAIGEFA